MLVAFSWARKVSGQSGLSSCCRRLIFCSSSMLVVFAAIANNVISSLAERTIMTGVHLMMRGWVLVLIGLLGLFLPVVPGVPLLIAALFVLARQYDWPRRLLMRGRRWFPTVVARAQQHWHRTSCVRGSRRGSSHLPIR